MVIVWFLVKFGKTCTHEFFKNAQIVLVLQTHAILYLFEKLTHACFPQIALKPYYYLYYNYTVSYF